ncbi:hypothetical protein AQUCO_01000370v1 [Aquilegia coerulea]|uniref:Mitochondrial import receptor subunit TOM6 homolog n=1 Tax=Aquilegia coerulea TaxID=218851 RepID=A0A2G5E9K2_AQUCA|nr:hypothetical protein AQUCO_01000370v1 [Aquilegia coerulea]
MFLGQMPKRPNRDEAIKQLKTHVKQFVAFCVVVRAVPYVLHYFCQESPELKIEI